MHEAIMPQGPRDDRLPAVRTGNATSWQLRVVEDTFMNTPQPAGHGSYLASFPVYAIVCPPFVMDRQTGRAVINEHTNWHVIQHAGKVIIPIFTDEDALGRYKSSRIKQVVGQMPITTPELLATILRNIVELRGAKVDVLVDPSEEGTGPIIGFDEIVSGGSDAS